MADPAARYAEALLMAAKQENAVQIVVDEMGFLAREFAQSASMFRSPVFPVREQLATVEYALGDKFHPLTKRFICLLASMRRLGGIAKITDTFRALAQKDMNKIELRITVHEEATPEMEEKIIQACKKRGLIPAEQAINADNPVPTNHSPPVECSKHPASPVHNSEFRIPNSEFGKFRIPNSELVNFSVDKSLLGGFIAQCEGIVWDCSLRTRHNDITKLMRKV